MRRKLRKRAWQFMCMALFGMVPNKSIYPQSVCYQGDFVVETITDIAELQTHSCIDGRLIVVDVGVLTNLDLGNVTNISGRLWVIGNQDLITITSADDLSVGSGLDFPRLKIKRNPKLPQCDVIDFIHNTDVVSSFQSGNNKMDGCW